eukprot:g36745.t1
MSLDAFRLTFDPNTAHKHLLLSNNNCMVTDVDPESVPYPEHPERFSNFPQVLCAESLSEGRSYWEVEISGHWAGMGVTYQGIKRKGSNMCSLIGRNSLSWCLLYSNSKYLALHNKQEVSLQSGRYQRIGIYLDYPEGTLDFYGIDNTMSLIHSYHFTKLTNKLAIRKARRGNQSRFLMGSTLCLFGRNRKMMSDAGHQYLR